MAEVCSVFGKPKNLAFSNIVKILFSQEVIINDEFNGKKNI